MKSMVVVSSRQMLNRFFIDKHSDNKDAHFRTQAPYHPLEVTSIVPTFLFPSINTSFHPWGADFSAVL